MDVSDAQSRGLTWQQRAHPSPPVHPGYLRLAAQFRARARGELGVQSAPAKQQQQQRPQQQDAPVRAADVPDHLSRVGALGTARLGALRRAGRLVDRQRCSGTQKAPPLRPGRRSPGPVATDSSSARRESAAVARSRPWLPASAPSPDLGEGRKDGEGPASRPCGPTHTRGAVLEPAPPSPAVPSSSNPTPCPVCLSPPVVRISLVERE